MIRRLPYLLLISALACSDRTPPPDTADQIVDLDSLEDAAAAEPVLPAMPDYPDAGSGLVAIHAVGAFELERSWPARAGRCARPAMVLVIAEQPGSGASVLLQLPPTDDLTGIYPVKLADSTGVPKPPAAQLGFQFFEAATADAYQAAEGTVDVRELSDRRVSGRFAVTMRHVVHNRLAQVAGTFRQVAVEALPPDWCEEAAAAQESLTVPDTARTPQ